MPYKGSRHEKLSGVRKLTFRPFKIFYRVHEERRVVEVLWFWHSARGNQGSDFVLPKWRRYARVVLARDLRATPTRTHT
jgi:hypothetical protein